MSSKEIELKYHDGEPVIREIQRVSKPGRRIYSSVKTMPTVRNGLGLSIVSTPKGVMSDVAARENNVGGEIIVASVYDPWKNIIGIIYNPDFKL